MICNYFQEHLFHCFVTAIFEDDFLVMFFGRLCTILYFIYVMYIYYTLCSYTLTIIRFCSLMELFLFFQGHSFIVTVIKQLIASGATNDRFIKPLQCWLTEVLNEIVIENASATVNMILDVDRHVGRNEKVKKVMADTVCIFQVN